MTGSGTSGRRPLQRFIAPIRRGTMPTHCPAGQMRILRRDTWVPPYRVRRSCRTGRRGRRPLQRLTAPIRRGRCPHIAPPAAQRGRQNRKIKTTFYFAILVAAAGDWTRKGTLTVPFHTILPSDICDRTGSLTGREAGASACLSVVRLFTWRSWRPHDRRGRPSDSVP